MKKAEKIANHYHSPRCRKDLKKTVRRARRQAERRDPENAPRKLKGYTWGWY